MVQLILILLILVFTTISTLAASYFGLMEKTGITIGYWIFLFALLSWTAFRLRFKNLKSFRYFLIKKYVWFKKKTNVHELTFRESTNTPIEEKAVKLWKLCLRDKDSNLSCSISTHTRQIEKDNLLIIFTYLNQVDFLMSILDQDKNKNCIYEVRIGHKLAEYVISSFDNENSRRMAKSEEERRKSINSDLDKLLQKEKNAISDQISKGEQTSPLDLDSAGIEDYSNISSTDIMIN